MSQHNYVLYGLRRFKDINKMMFLRNSITEGNVHDLFTAHITRDIKIKQTGKIYLCCLTGSEFTHTDESGNKLYHLFLLHETDDNIILLDRKQNYYKSKRDILSTINPYDLSTVLEFKVIMIKSGEDLYINTIIPDQHTLH